MTARSRGAVRFQEGSPTFRSARTGWLAMRSATCSSRSPGTRCPGPALPDLSTIAGDGDTTLADFAGECTQRPDGTYEFRVRPAGARHDRRPGAADRRRHAHVNSQAVASARVSQFALGPRCTGSHLPGTLGGG